MWVTTSRNAFPQAMAVALLQRAPIIYQPSHKPSDHKPIMGKFITPTRTIPAWYFSPAPGPKKSARLHALRKDLKKFKVKTIKKVWRKKKNVSAPKLAWLFAKPRGERKSYRLSALRGSTINLDPTAKSSDSPKIDNTQPPIIQSTHVPLAEPMEEAEGDKNVGDQNVRSSTVGVNSGPTPAPMEEAAADTSTLASAPAPAAPTSPSALPQDQNEMSQVLFGTANVNLPITPRLAELKTKEMFHKFTSEREKENFSRSSMKEVLRREGRRPKANVINSVWGALDGDGNGKVEFSEFAQCVKGLSQKA
ncbi:hypothetical protein AAMO2058_001207500 [Amorphochlora amoebiformis]